MDEILQALRAREFGLTEDELAALIAFAYKCVTVYDSPNRDRLRGYSSRLDDEKDLHVLASFERLDCDMLVTGDRELLGKVNGAKTTRQAIERLLGWAKFQSMMSTLFVRRVDSKTFFQMKKRKPYLGFGAGTWRSIRKGDEGPRMFFVQNMVTT